MLKIWLGFAVTAVWAVNINANPAGPPKEFLTEKEIALIQDAQEIDARAKIYLAAAALRLKTAEERLYGKESAEGDPFEFYSPEDLLDGYYRILRSVMLNLDEAYQRPGANRQKIRGALKDLKKATEKAAKDLEVLKKLAEEKRKEELWDLVNRAIDITGGANEGAESGLSRLAPAPAGRDKKGEQ